MAFMPILTGSSSLSRDDKAIFVSISHQPGLKTRSFLWWGFREGRVRARTETCALLDLGLSLAHFVQCKPHEPAGLGFTRYYMSSTCACS